MAISEELGGEASCGDLDDRTLPLCFSAVVLCIPIYIYIGELSIYVYIDR